MREKTGYNSLQIGLHWLIVILIAINYFVSDGMGRAFFQHMRDSTGASPSGTAAIHVYLGLAVFFLALFRLAVRLVSGAPEAPHDGPEWMRLAGIATHWALYALIIIVPWLGGYAWYVGVPTAANLHVVLMNLMLILAGLHALAALYHQYVLKDGLLRRMMRPS